MRIFTRTVLALLATVLLGFSASAFAESVHPEKNWNFSRGFMSPNERAARLQGVDLQERKDGGFYDQWQIKTDQYITNCVNTGSGATTSTESSQTATADGSGTYQSADPNTYNNNTGNVQANQTCDGGGISTGGQ